MLHQRSTSLQIRHSTAKDPGGLFLEPLWLAEQLFVIGRSPTLCADVTGIAHELLVKHKIRFQQLLHFAKSLRHDS